VEKAQQTREELEKEQESKLLERIEKFNQGHEKSIQETEKIAMKAKEYNEKALSQVEAYKEKLAQEAELKKKELESKLLQAESKREQILESVKQQAQRFQTKRSSTDAALEADA
jgi:DNA-binding protein